MNREDLKHRRENLGLTQEQLARELDVTVLTISRWERGVYPVPKHIELAVEALEKRRKEAA